MKKIGVIDADLIDNGTRFPNLAVMKISAYKKKKGNEVSLLTSYNNIQQFDEIFVSKVFHKTRLPNFVHKNVHFGGTGFYDVDAVHLDNEIEHTKPDYSIYNEYIQQETQRGIKPSHFEFYKKYSIGFTTRGCFRKCPFCVNRRYDEVIHHSPVKEFIDDSRPYIVLLDDNILGYSKWEDVFSKLNETGKKFCFKQGLDIRLMTTRIAYTIQESNYHKDIYFAFDNIDNKDKIERGLKTYRLFCDKPTRAYVLCGFHNQGELDINSIFERISILSRYKVLPYIMRHSNVAESPFKKMYSFIAAWCNQPRFFKKLSFGEFCEIRQNTYKDKTSRFWELYDIKQLNKHFWY